MSDKLSNDESVKDSSEQQIPGMPADFDPSKLMDMIPGIDPEMIDKGLEAMNNFDKWGKQLEWAVSAIKSLAEQNIKLRGRLDKLESE